MFGIHVRSSHLVAAALLTISSTLYACGGDSTGGGTTGTGGAGGNGSTASSSTAASSSSVTSSGSGCPMAGIPGGTIRGKITFTGTVGAKDVLRIGAFKDGKPGIPSGFTQQPAPTFPFSYEITDLPADATGAQFGVLAYLDIGGNNVAGPGMEDPQSMNMTLVTVTDCEGASLDVDIPSK